jgi:hypothetical protein
LAICFSCILSGCGTIRSITPNKMVWPVPDKPKTQRVIFIKADNGYTLTVEEARRLTDNITELKAYIQKLEALIDGMKSYYVR